MTPLDAANGRKGRIPARFLDPLPAPDTVTGAHLAQHYEAQDRAAGCCPYTDNRPCVYARTWECDQTCGFWPFGGE